MRKIALFFTEIFANLQTRCNNAACKNFGQVAGQDINTGLNAMPVAVNILGNMLPPDISTRIGVMLVVNTLGNTLPLHISTGIGAV
jgi:hypothetical protein